MCGTPQRSRSTSTSSFNPGTAMAPSSCTSTAALLFSSASGESAARAPAKTVRTTAMTQELLMASSPQRIAERRLMEPLNASDSNPRKPQKQPAVATSKGLNDLKQRGISEGYSPGGRDVS